MFFRPERCHRDSLQTPPGCKDPTRPRFWDPTRPGFSQWPLTIQAGFSRLLRARGLMIRAGSSPYVQERLRMIFAGFSLRNLAGGPMTRTLTSRSRQAHRLMIRLNDRCRQTRPRSPLRSYQVQRRPPHHQQFLHSFLSQFPSRAGGEYLPMIFSATGWPQSWGCT